MFSLRLTPDFLRSLEAVCLEEKDEAWGSLLTNLENVYRAETSPGEGHLNVTQTELAELARHLREWRILAEEKVRSLTNRLTCDDPLFCPVSLFGVMDYARLETAHTRVLAWFLDPEESHGFGSNLLASFLAQVPGCPKLEQLRIKKVAAEYRIAYGKRIDILAMGTWISEHCLTANWLLAVEAKIDSQEQSALLDQYNSWIDGQQAEAFRVFLTPDGKKPRTGNSLWNPLSFIKLAAGFSRVSRDIDKGPGLHFLRYYVAGVLHEICGLPASPAQFYKDPYRWIDRLKEYLSSRG